MGKGARESWDSSGRPFGMVHMLAGPTILPCSTGEQGAQQGRLLVLGKVGLAPRHLTLGPAAHHRQWRAKRVTHSKGSSESSSGLSESSNEDSAYRDGSYWKVGAGILGLPSWISKCREAFSPSAGEVWGERPEGGGGQEAQPHLKDFEDRPRGAFILKGQGEIINRYFINIFTLLRLEVESGKTRTKQDKKGP